jgi:hypothetical protein
VGIPLFALLLVAVGLAFLARLVFVYYRDGYDKPERPWRVITESYILRGDGLPYGVLHHDQREKRERPIKLNRAMRKWVERQERRGLVVAFDEHGVPYTAGREPS